MSDIIINHLPLTKSEQTSLAQITIDAVNNGELNPLSVELKLKAMEEVIKTIRAEIKSQTIEEAEKYGKTFEHQGVKVTVSSRTTRDFTGCGDTLYNEMASEVERLKAQMKAREAMLLTGVNPETGETYVPPRTETTQYLTLKF